MIHRDRKGFTLIELLVVIAIIGILASIILVSLTDARQKARDARRIADVRQTTLALESYYDDNGQYPGALSALSPDYISVVPTDPQTGNAYPFNSNNCTPANQQYVLGAVLENAENPALNTDVDGTQCSINCDDPTYCIMP